MARIDPVFHIRINEVLKETLKQKSVENRRTMTAEIIDRLERSLEKNDCMIGEGKVSYSTEIDTDMLTGLLLQIQASAQKNALKINEEQLKSCINETYALLKAGRAISPEMLDSFVRLCAR